MNTKRTVFVALLLICIGSAVGALVLYLQFLHPIGRYGVYLALSSSMQPTIMKGNYILVDKSVIASDTVAAPYPDGDVIVFHPSPGSNELIVHRAIEWHDSTTLITKGDNNTAPGPPLDGKVQVTWVIGKVVDYNYPMTHFFWGFWLLVCVALATSITGLVYFLIGRSRARALPSPPLPPSKA